MNREPQKQPIECCPQPDYLCFGPQGERCCERPRVSVALRASAQFRVQVVCAPVGSGKSVALQHFSAETGAAYIGLREHPLKMISTVDDFFAALPGHADVVILDDFDSLPTELIDGLVERINTGTDPRRFIVAGRSRRRMRVARLLARGIGELIDGAVLAFNHQEVAAIADHFSLRYDDNDLAQVLYDTEGWAVAVHWVIRVAAQNDLLLRGAFEAWCETKAHLFSEFIIAEHGRNNDDFLRFLMLLRSGFEGAGDVLEKYDELGFPVVRTRTSLRPSRVLLRFANEENVVPQQGQASYPLMKLKVLGRFRCEIGDRPLTFVRRRDQNVLIFVAISPNGRATRRELIDAFWPGVDPVSATQGLRTALSRIRQAISALVGPAAVDVYFQSVDDVCIDAKHVALDLRRFLEHHALGELEEANGDVAAARRHYTAADRLYTDQLLASEQVAPCFEKRVRELEETYSTMLARLIALDAAEGRSGAVEAWTSKFLRRTAAQPRHALPAVAPLQIAAAQ